MGIMLSDKEASILLGATLMHWGVPFRFSVKHELADEEQAIIDGASEKLIALREAYQQSRNQGSQQVQLSEQEIRLLVKVVDDCVRECGDDLVELNLQLATSARTEVDSLLERLRAHGQSLQVSPRSSR